MTDITSIPGEPEAVNRILNGNDNNNNNEAILSPTATAEDKTMSAVDSVPCADPLPRVEQAPPPVLAVADPDAAAGPPLPPPPPLPLPPPPSTASASSISPPATPKAVVSSSKKSRPPYKHDPDKITLRFLFANKDGLTVTVECNPSDTVNEVKGALLSVWPEGLPDCSGGDQLRLICMGKGILMPDTRTLEDLQVPVFKTHPTPVNVSVRPAALSPTAAQTQKGSGVGNGGNRGGHGRHSHHNHGNNHHSGNNHRSQANNTALASQQEQADQGCSCIIL